MVLYLGRMCTHMYTYAPPRCRTSQYRRTFIRMSVSLWNDLGVPIFDDVGLVGFKSRANALLLAYLLAPFFCLLLFSLSLLHSIGWYCVAGVFGLIGC